MKHLMTFKIFETSLSVEDIDLQIHSSSSPLENPPDLQPNFNTEQEKETEEEQEDPYPELTFRNRDRNMLQSNSIDPNFSDASLIFLNQEWKRSVSN